MKRQQAGSRVRVLAVGGGRGRWQRGDDDCSGSGRHAVPPPPPHPPEAPSAAPPRSSRAAGIAAPPPPPAAPARPSTEGTWLPARRAGGPAPAPPPPPRPRAGRQRTWRDLAAADGFPGAPQRAASWGRSHGQGVAGIAAGAAEAAAEVAAAAAAAPEGSPSSSGPAVRLPSAFMFRVRLVGACQERGFKWDDPTVIVVGDSKLQAPQCATATQSRCRGVASGATAARRPHGGTIGASPKSNRGAARWHHR